MFTRPATAGDNIKFPGTLPGGRALTSGSTEYVRVLNIPAGRLFRNPSEKLLFAGWTGNDGRRSCRNPGAAPAGHAVCGRRSAGG
ncbi:MAG: hypothetical protein LBJ47_00630 [Tannerella sp.]|nr:hypothetical protein [Tannerella sp.]